MFVHNTIFQFRGHPKSEGEEDLQGHICNVEETFFQDGGSTIIGYCCRSHSYRANPYEITLELDQQRNVTTRKCSCLGGGDGWCKHTSALYTWVNFEKTLSKTDRPQQWHIPSKFAQMLYRESKPVVELWGGKKVEHDFNPTDEKIARQKARMEKFGLLVSLISFLIFPACF